MTKEMFINAVVPEDIRIAILENGRLEGYFQESAEAVHTRGNIYLGRITNVERALDACFVEYGESRHGFLPFSEMPGSDAEPGSDKSLKRGMSVVVQVDKEPVGTKGARLTSCVSLAGRYLVLMPHSETRGVSRRLGDEERQKFKEIGARLDPPEGMGFIIRTAGQDRSKRELAQDMTLLVRLWKEIEDHARRREQPGLLHADADIVQRALRDYYSNDIGKVWIDDPYAFECAQRFFELFMPRQRQVLQAYKERTPLFSQHGIEEEIEAIHQRRVSLPSGGSLVIESTEALVAIDVNSGKTKSALGQEETVFATNQEAAREIARQLRLRDLGGIIVIDFIDMVHGAHNAAVEKVLKEALKPDKARHQMGKISSFGLCTLTRQRLGQCTCAIGYQDCPTCQGEGVVRAADDVAVRLLRRIQAAAAKGAGGRARVRLHPDLANHLQNRHRPRLLALEREFGWTVEVEADPTLNRGQEQIEMVLPAVERVSESAPSTTRPTPLPQPVPSAQGDPRTGIPAQGSVQVQENGPVAVAGMPGEARSRHRRRRHRRRGGRTPGPVGVNQEPAQEPLPPGPSLLSQSASSAVAPFGGEPTGPAPDRSPSPQGEPPPPLGPRPGRRRRHRRRRRKSGGNLSSPVV